MGSPLDVGGPEGYIVNGLAVTGGRVFASGGNIGLSFVASDLGSQKNEPPLVGGVSVTATPGGKVVVGKYRSLTRMTASGVIDGV